MSGAADKRILRPAERETPESAQLLQFLSWTAPVTLGFALFAAASAAVLGDARLGAAAAVLLAYGGLLLAARALVGRGRCRLGILLARGGLLAATLVEVVVQPSWLPILVVTPLLAVAVALPYTDDRSLLRLIYLAWLVTVAVATIGEISYSPSSSRTLFGNVFVVGAIAAATAVTLLVLWQFRSRLSGVLARTRAAEERYALAARGANDGLWDWDLVNERVYFSPRWKGMLGYAEHQIGSDPKEWLGRLHPDDRARFEAELAAHLEGATHHFGCEYRLLHGDGGYRWMLGRGLVVTDEEERPVRIAGSQTDVTERKRAEERLRHDAMHDALTGLPNRALVEDRLDVLARRLEGGGNAFALLLLDLDRFGSITSNLGHPAGDRVLVEVARRLGALLPRPRDAVAHLGRDEFAIVLEDARDLRGALRIAERVQEGLAAPFSTGEEEVFVTASVGIVLATPDHARPERLLRDAEAAAHRAKTLGVGRCEVYDADRHTRAIALFRLETDLRRAFAGEEVSGEISVHYQPIASLETGRLVGFEALARWRHPERGFVPAEVFVPIAEESGLIFPLGRFVLRESCRQMFAWRARHPAHRPLTISVNVSRVQLAEPGFVEAVGGTLEEIGLQARSLRLELTETAVGYDAEPATRVLARLRALGVEVHVDDFGTGYSSLSSLHRLPVDALKIDRSFVREPHGDDAEIVRTIVSLAHNLGLDVVAEGLETARQLEYLRGLGCDFGQGSLLSRPLAPNAAEELLAADPRW